MEKWQDVKGYEGFYKVSNFGSVKSLERVVSCKGGKTKINKEKILKGIKFNTGYICVNLSKYGKITTRSIHSLVAEAFLGNKPKSFYHVMHLDGNKENNHVSNLRYGSPSCNAAFMIDDGTVSRGTKRHNAKLNEKAVVEIRQLVKNGTPYDLIQQQFGICKTTISAVVSKQNWAWVE